MLALAGCGGGGQKARPADPPKTVAGSQPVRRVDTIRRLVPVAAGNLTNAIQDAAAAPYAGGAVLLGGLTPADAPGWAIEEIDAYREGDVAWATILGPYPIGDGDAIPARGSVVCRREDGEWKIVNWTFSLAVPNDALEPGSPVVAALAVAHV